MAKWEYAAIVQDQEGEEWALRQSELECCSHIELEISKQSRKFTSWLENNIGRDVELLADRKVIVPIPHIHSWKNFPEHDAAMVRETNNQVHGQLLHWMKKMKKLNSAKRKKEWEAEIGAYIVSSKLKPCNQTNKHLFKSNDILELVNMAGADGWEITGGLGLSNSQPGVHETRWRIMRREL